jgi:exopolysaccharide production protein ExoY
LAACSKERDRNRLRAAAGSLGDPLGIPEGGMSVVEQYQLEARDFIPAPPTTSSIVRESNAKRLFDIVCALLLLIAALPFILIVSCVVAADGGPVLYRDKRFGRNGAVFDCIKFRTMRPDAERMLAEYLARHPAALDEWVKDCKLRRDPRITRVGFFLRKSGLDELPQIWNVFLGEMSMVGPRPISILHGEERLYGRYMDHYRQLRPGITGLWQVSGRNDVPYRRRIAMVVYYARKWSIALDALILVKTVGAMMTGRGGY